MKLRNTRQKEIRRLVRSKPIKTQKELVELLRAQGFGCTQATVSRDINELQLQKNSSGAYVLAEDVHLRRMLCDLSETIRQAGNMVVIKALPGTAPGVAAAIDGAEVADVVGSIAGDDTILVICENEQTATDMFQKLKEYKIQGSKERTKRK